MNTVANAKNKQQTVNIVAASSELTMTKNALTDTNAQCKNGAGNGESPALWYIYSEKGKKCLVVDGQVFYKNRVRSDGTHYWRCSRYAMNCRRRVHTFDDRLTQMIGEHNHELIEKINTVPSRRPRRMTKRWQNHEVEQLINYYEHNQLLWDHSSVDYKDKRKRADAIDDMAIIFDTNKDQIYIKLHNLRNRFSNEMKKYKLKKATDPTYTSKWEYFDRLMFVEPSIEYTGPPLSNLVINNDTITDIPIKQEKADSLDIHDDDDDDDGDNNGSSDNDTNEYYSYSDATPTGNVKSFDLPPNFFTDNSEFSKMSATSNNDSSSCTRESAAIVEHQNCGGSNCKKRKLNLVNDSDSRSRDFQESLAITSPISCSKVDAVLSSASPPLPPLPPPPPLPYDPTPPPQIHQIPSSSSASSAVQMTTLVSHAKLEQDNEVELFGKYIASQLKQMPPDVSLQLQLEIQGLIGRKRLQLMNKIVSQPFCSE